MPTRENHAPSFKARVALAALSEKKTLAELSSEFGVHQSLIHNWAKQLRESAADIFSDERATKAAIKGNGAQKIHNNIGQLTGEERDFLLKVFGQ